MSLLDVISSLLLSGPQMSARGFAVERGDGSLTRRVLGPSGPVKVAKKEADAKPAAKPATTKVSHGRFFNARRPGSQSNQKAAPKAATTTTATTTAKKAAPKKTATKATTKTAAAKKTGTTKKSAAKPKANSGKARKTPTAVSCGSHACSLVKLI